MKTIEERANDHCQLVEYTHNKRDCEIAFKSYTQGDADRKAIEDDHLREATKMLIDKACEWICKDCDRCVADADKMARCPRLKMFHKTMEEKIWERQ